MKVEPILLKFSSYMHIKIIIMKKAILISLCALFLLTGSMSAQKGKKIIVPQPVKTALAIKYPGSASAKITWETEKGNYEANWGGKGGEDKSVQFTPAGEFIEIVEAIPIKELPKAILSSIKKHYPGVKVTEAGKVTTAAGKVSYEAEIHGKDILFDKNGNKQKVD